MINTGSLILVGTNVSRPCLFSFNESGGKLRGDPSFIQKMLTRDDVKLRCKNSGWSARILLQSCNKTGEAKFCWR